MAVSKAKTEAAASTSPGVGIIEQLSIKAVSIGIVGLDPGLLTHKFSSKTQKAITQKAAGKGVIEKAPETIDEIICDCLYELSDPTDGATYGFPASGFKDCIVKAASRHTKLKGTVLSGAFYIVGGTDGLVPIISEAWRPTSVPGRNPNGRGACIIHRPLFPGGWRANLEIEYNEGSVSVDQLLNLLELGGFSTGVGDWRPERRGMFGRFEVDRERGIHVVR